MGKIADLKIVKKGEIIKGLKTGKKGEKSNTRKQAQN